MRSGVVDIGGHVIQSHVSCYPIALLLSSAISRSFVIKYIHIVPDSAPKADRNARNKDASADENYWFRWRHS